MFGGFGNSGGPFGHQQTPQFSTNQSPVQQQSIFGSPFGQQSNSVFGPPPPQQKVFTFGQNTQQPQPTPIFGSATSGQGVFNQWKPFPTPATLVPTTGASTSVNSTNVAPGGLAWFTNSPISGTVTTKFAPTTGAFESNTTNGTTSTYIPRYQCITLMKEYESKSAEELRTEDYLQNRKGPQPLPVQFPSFTSTTTTSTATSFPLWSNTTTKPTNSGTSMWNNGTNATTPAAVQPSIQKTPGFVWPTTKTGTTTTAFPSGSAPTFPAASSIFPAPNSSMPASTLTFPAPATNPFQAPTHQQATFPATNGIFPKPSVPASISFAPLPQPQSTNLWKPAGTAPGIFNQPQPAATAPSSWPSLFPASGNVAAPTASETNNPFAPTTQAHAPQVTGLFNPTQSSVGQIGMQTFPAATNTAISTAGSTLTGCFPNPAPQQSLPVGYIQTQPAQTPPVYSLGSQASTFMNPYGGNSTMAGTPGGVNLLGTQQAPGFFVQSSPQPHFYTPPFAVTPYKDSRLFYNLPTGPRSEQSNRSTFHGGESQSLRTRTNVQVTTTRFTPPSRPCSSKVKQLIYPNLEAKPQSLLRKTNIFEGFSDDDESLHGVDIFSPKNDVKRLYNVQNMRPVGTGSQINQGKQKHDGACQRCLLQTLTKDMGTQHEDQDLLNMLDMNPSQSEDKNNGELSPKPVSTPERACRVNCTKPGYYTIPPLSELDKMVDENGNCIVPAGFQVGRHNYGRIRFLTPVNVAGVDIDEVVLFGLKELMMYPETGKVEKPAVGIGLNCPAEIELESVWPVDKHTKEMIKCRDKVEQIQYGAKLKRACERMNAQFVSYCSITGTWKFAVKYF